jgi:plasmid stabilization system protein ParE
LPHGLASNHRSFRRNGPGGYRSLRRSAHSDAAARLGFELITRAESLANFPEIGRKVTEFHQSELREIICRSYRIIYRLNRDKQQIHIVRFWHGARGFPHIPGKI